MGDLGGGVGSLGGGGLGEGGVSELFLVIFLSLLYNIFVYQNQLTGCLKCNYPRVVGNTVDE